MEASAHSTHTPPDESGLPDGTPEIVRRVARGEKITPGQERVATAWFKAPHIPLTYKIPVQFDAEDGERQLTFFCRQLEGPMIERIERRNTEGEPPFGKMDELTTAAELIQEALVRIEEERGEPIDAGDELFRTTEDGTVLPAISIALMHHFRYQSGLLLTVASEIRRLSGFSADRVGQASRVLIGTAGN